MNKFHFTFNALIACAFFLVFTSVAQAQVPRTFVSADGKDSNSCDVPDKPCRDIQAAITKVQAGGEVIVITSGSYQPFTANKSVTVAAAPGKHAGITAPSSFAVVVSAGSMDMVVLRGLTLNGLDGSGAGTPGPNGIDYFSGAALSIENCVIHGFAGNGIRVGGNGEQLFVTDTVVRDTGMSAIFFGTTFGPSKASINRSRLENTNGGLFVTNNAKATIRDSVVSGSKGTGIQAFTFMDGATAEINVENCLVTGGTGAGIQANGIAGAAQLIRVSNTTVTNNNEGIAAILPAGTILSRGNNTVEGNMSDGSFTGTFAAK